MIRHLRPSIAPVPDDLHNKLDPYSLEYIGCANMNFPREGSGKLNRLTDIHTLYRTYVHLCLNKILSYRRETALQGAL